MTSPTPNLTLTLRGRDYGGWLRVRIERAANQATIQWGVIGTRDWPGMEALWDFAPGDAIRGTVGDKPVVTGWVDTISPAYGAEQHQIEISGRGLVSDLCDCSPEGAPTEWKQTPAGTIITQIAAVFGIEVRIEADLAPPLDFKRQQGEAGWESISRICKLRQCLAYEEPDGTLLVTRVSQEYCDTDLIQGENIKDATAKLDDKDRYSVYIVKGQQPAAKKAGVAPKQAAQSVAQVQDPSIRRFRPMVIVQGASTNNGEALERAKWEMQKRWGAGREAEIVVQGWHTKAGLLWPVNRLCRLQDTWLGIDRDMSIIKAAHELGARGSLTTLTLQPPEALTPEPESLSETKKGKAKGGKGKGKGKGGGGSTIWEQVRADYVAGERRRTEAKQ